MKFIEAFETGRPIKRPCHFTFYRYTGRGYLEDDKGNKYYPDLFDIFADDWIVHREPRLFLVTIDKDGRIQPDPNGVRHRGPSGTVIVREVIE